MWKIVLYMLMKQAEAFLENGEAYDFRCQVTTMHFFQSHSGLHRTVRLASVP